MRIEMKNTLSSCECVLYVCMNYSEGLEMYFARGCMSVHSNWRIKSTSVECAACNVIISKHYLIRRLIFFSTGCHTQRKEQRGECSS